MKDTSGRQRDATTGRVPLERLRSEFPILDTRAYLNSNSLGALSRRSMAERHDFELQWNELGASAWYELWVARLEAVRAGFGRTIGAGPGQIALMPSVSAALTAVAGAIDYASGRNKVVLTDLDFPTVGHQFLSRQRLGIEVQIVESPDGIEVPPEALRAAVDERTALVVTSHVFFTTGAIQDAAAVAEIAHDAGALMLLDAYQSNGQLPIDVEALGVDFLTSGALKWLCGGPGLAYLYVRPDVRIEPTTLSWFGAERQFEFDIRDAGSRKDARRFEMGTPAVGAAYTAAGGLEIIEEAGIDRIRDRNRDLAEDLIDRLREAGYELRLAPHRDRRSALVLARHPDPPAAVQRLAEQGVIVDSRGDYVRFSPHFYNTLEDNARAVEALSR
jgi:selenocysteine lyase/cysteine desulfurase